MIRCTAHNKPAQEPSLPPIEQEAWPSRRLSPTLAERLTVYDPARDLRCRLRIVNLQEMDNNLDHRIFLLSPAYAGGERARMILSDGAQFELARKLRGKSGAPIADVFTFLSGLYFRGKIAYATH